MPTFFLCLAIFGALVTANAYVAQRRTGPLVIFGFFAGWLVSELPLHVLAIQAVGALLLVATGAAEGWQGQIALALTFASWGGLLGLLPIARQSRTVVAAALDHAMGADYRDRWLPEVARAQETPMHRGRHLRPFKMLRPDVERLRDIPYIDDGDPKHMVDIYRPRNPVPGMTPAPVLLQIHGGGWIIGNKKEQALPLMNLLAARGWICVTTNYRLSPKATFPDHLLDVKQALRWIKEHIHEYGGDPDFVIATGGSAGGHLSSLLTLTANDPEYQPGFESLDTSLNGCVPIYGVYDFTNQHGFHPENGLIEILEKRVLKKSLASDRDAFLRASPLHRVHSDAPPMYVVHGDQDGLAPVEEARKFVELLRASSKSPVAYAEIPGAQHAFEIFHSPRCSTVVESISEFVATLHSEHLQKRQGGSPTAP